MFYLLKETLYIYIYIYICIHTYKYTYICVYTLELMVLGLGLRFGALAIWGLVLRIWALIQGFTQVTSQELFKAYML